MENKAINMDDMLREAFLDLDFNHPKNEQLLFASSNALLTKKHFIKPINGSNLGGIKLIVLIIITSVFSISIIGLNDQVEPRYQANVVSFEEFVNEEEVVVAKLPKMSLYSFNNQVTPLNSRGPKKANYFAPIIQAEKKEELKIYRPKELVEIPELSPDDVLLNEKRKKKLIKDLLKFEKTRFSEINSSVDNSEIKGLPFFSIWKTELSNFEYKIFLNDLLINQRRESYINARTHDEIWLELSADTSFMKPMEEMYSSHPAYYEYPVVNISREGAQLFCDWLTSEVNKSVKNKEKLIRIRIPTDKEWEYVASSGKKRQPYPWGGDFVRNSKGNYLANFYPVKGNYVADGAFFTTKVLSYFPNEFGVYNIVGNVAEMVDYPHSGEIGAKGGSWKDSAAYIKIYAEDINLGISEPKPTIGFRPVIVYQKEIQFNVDDEKDEVSIVLTEEQIAANNKRKAKKMSELLNLVKHDFLPMSMSKLEDSEVFKGVYIQKTEVSNIDYKTFLFDLIIQKRMDEFHIAKPNQELWRSLAIPNEPYVEFYFFHSAYDHFPVVNITAQGAELYGKWLLEEAKKVDQKNKLSHLKRLRLPNEVEWTAAATALGQHSPYPWKEKGVRNQEKKHRGKALANFKTGRGDYMGVAGNLNDNADIIAPIRSYWPNNFGLYNMAGNVAEMIQYKDGDYGCKGGGWNSNAEQIKINAIDTTKGYLKPGPTIGFRLVGEYIPESSTTIKEK